MDIQLLDVAHTSGPAVSLLNIARGPALKAAIAIFFFGVTWRLVSIFLLHRNWPLSTAREHGTKPLGGALRSIFTFRRPRLSRARRSPVESAADAAVAVGSRSWPHPPFVRRTLYAETVGYLYHIGLAIVVVLAAPHILVMKSLFGVSWPGIPMPIITIIAVLTLATLFAVLLRRIGNPVLRKLSNFDDYFSWAVVTLVFATGLMAHEHIGSPYQDVLAWHILSFDLLLAWFPFSKLMHAFFLTPSRAVAGYLLKRRGASV